MPQFRRKETFADAKAMVMLMEAPASTFYLNLNARQSLFLYNDVYCDYLLVANQLYTVMKRQYPGSFHLAVSRKFEGCECLPEILEQLERFARQEQIGLAAVQALGAV